VPVASAQSLKSNDIIHRQFQAYDEANGTGLTEAYYGRHGLVEQIAVIQVEIAELGKQMTAADCTESIVDRWMGDQYELPRRNGVCDALRRARMAKEKSLQPKYTRAAQLLAKVSEFWAVDQGRRIDETIQVVKAGNIEDPSAFSLSVRHLRAEAIAHRELVTTVAIYEWKSTRNVPFFEGHDTGPLAIRSQKVDRMASAVEWIQGRILSREATYSPKVWN
jgi:hypothetical protein